MSAVQAFPESLDNHGTTSEAGVAEQPFRLRSYQAEMVAESLKNNIICVIDTGSGKTHMCRRAVERTRRELETCSREKIVWFLAPTVTLCEQQYDVFRSNLPAYGIQIFIGKDNTDHWSDKRVWDAVLHNVRIVISTHQVLLDALTHAFIKLETLALIIFDEAHHCTKQHPARQIMQNFYVPEMQRGNIHVPRVLGLTASPVMTAKGSRENLEQIEQNLCATTRTPKLHRTELLRFVYMPQLISMTFPVGSKVVHYSNLISSLRKTCDTYDLKNDPYVLDLQRQRSEGYDVHNQLRKVFQTGKTYCRDEISTLFTKAMAMSEELGSSPAEWYIARCISQFRNGFTDNELRLRDLSSDERRHLLSVFHEIPDVSTWNHAPISLDGISRKVNILIDLLVEVATETPEFTALVFVEQRAWIAALAEILTKHPRTANLFRIGTFVGVSQSSKRKGNVASFAEPNNQQSTLEDFRAGKINLILATSVLEEGIDVSNCHLVICFERPKNLKSFVQRRGRARMQKSKYIVFQLEGKSGHSPESWQSLEEEMKAAYMDEMRLVKAAEEQELGEDEGTRHFRVASTGALLTLDNASQHLHHFCAILGSGPYIDTRPQFHFTENTEGFVTARVALPIFVDVQLRVTAGNQFWRTERMASRDAAFEAYKALYMAGLVDDHLLPAVQEPEEEPGVFLVPNQPSLVWVMPTFQPWPIIAQMNDEYPGSYSRMLLSLQDAGKTTVHMVLLTKVAVPYLPEITLHWNESHRVGVVLEPLSDVTLRKEDVDSMRSVTLKILGSVFAGKMQNQRKDFLWMLLPCDEQGSPFESKISKIFEDSSPAAEMIIQGLTDLSAWGLVSVRGDGQKYIAKNLSISRAVDEGDKTGTLISASVLPKRRDFLRPPVIGKNSHHAYTKVEQLDASQCAVESVPATYAIFTILLPSILHRLEMGLVAQTAMTTLLKKVAFEQTKDLPMIIRALTSSSTNEEHDYQRLEFLGDCILKFLTSIHLMAKHPKWPEGHLTGAKGRIVSNGYLAKASLAVGLEKFTFTKIFGGSKWAPPYAGDLAEATDRPLEQRSSKVIADVVESLIGASCEIGGLEKALVCVQTLLPLEPWIPVTSANSTLYDATSEDDLVAGYDVAEVLLGYSLSKKALLVEALTHASFMGPSAGLSYERLEFLGDVVLDKIVTERLFKHKPDLSHQKMHGIRTAMVNAAFLAFRLMETKEHQTLINKSTLLPEQHCRYLWQYLRFSDAELRSSRDDALKRHETVRQQILVSLEQDARFPWHLLGLIEAPKALSDIVESMIGAIYTDSHGNFAACETFTRRLGILDCLERILRDEVDCLHPKERLGHLAIEQKVQYIRIKEESSAGDAFYRCQVQVGGENVGGVVEGLKRLSTETMAAFQACAIIEQRNSSAMTDADGDDVFFDAEEGGGARSGST